MIDVHLHVLPGIDDGAADFEEAAEMCRVALADGCETLILTPHQRHELWENRDRRALESLCDRLQEKVGESPTLHLGAEIRVDSGLLADLESGPDSGPVALAGSRYLLLELDRQGFGPNPPSLTHELILAGWRPIFAHPEFVPPFAEDPNLVLRLAAMGAYFQITAMSLTGGFGRRARSVCERLLDLECVHFVASDAHGLDRRRPGLGGAYREIERRWGRRKAWELTTANPAAILADRPLDRSIRDDLTATGT